MPHYSIYSMRIENFLLNVFYMKWVARWHLYKARNQNRIKHAKTFGSPVNGYIIRHVECRNKEPFESNNLDAEHYCCRAYGISNMWTFFFWQFNNHTNLDKWDVEQMRSQTAKMDPIHLSMSFHFNSRWRAFDFNLFTSISLLLWRLLNIYVFVSTYVFFCQWGH